MNGASRRRADSDPNLTLASKTLRLARSNFGRKSSSSAVPPPKEMVNPHQEFVYTAGSKLHTFGREEAPWPFAFNREILELCGLDHSLIAWGRGKQILVDFQGKTPKRCLDLGTALGDWVVDTAKYLPDCTFVGFDMVDIQIPLKYVAPEIAERIEWVHGNFLQCPLPFKDNEFDFIHVEGIALGVPENKWDQLFDELNRILMPGGYIELIQQDARFPVLPRWFTEPLHAHLQQFAVSLPDGSHSPYLLSPTSEELPHAYALLEELYVSVFESRFINPTPSSIMPRFFNTTFRHVVSPPILHFPMPPLAPLAPFPKSTAPFTNETSSNPLDINQYFLPTAEATEDQQDPSALTVNTNLAQAVHSLPASPIDTQYPADVFSPPANHSRLQRASSIASLDRIARSRIASSTNSTPAGSRSPSVARSTAVLNASSTTRLGGESTTELFKMERLAVLGNDMLFMHLYHAARMVVAAKEAMWEELMKKVERRDLALVKYGWGEDEYGETESRAKFDALIRRYEQDMHIRLSLWNSLVKCGWTYPRRGQMTEAELHREEDLRRAILEARKNAKEEDFSTPSRSIRLLIGIKST